MQVFLEEHADRSFASMIEFFGFEMEESGLERAIQMQRSWAYSSASSNAEPEISPAEMKFYLSLEPWIPRSPQEDSEMLARFARWHYKRGDAFQVRNHKRLGAQFVRTIPGSRAEPPEADLLSGFSNMLMSYRVLSPPRPVIDLAGNMRS